MTNVDRYDITQHEEDWAYMEQCPDGDWVRIDSYQALEAERDKLADLLQEVVSEYVHGTMAGMSALVARIDATLDEVK